MTEFEVPRQESAADIFNRSALPVFEKFTERTVVSVHEIRRRSNELSAAFSAQLEAARAWLPELGTKAFLAYLENREPSNLNATGDAIGLQTICASLTRGMSYSAEVAKQLNDSLVTIFIRASKISYQDLCALDSLGREVGPGLRLQYLKGCAALITKSPESKPWEIKFLLTTLRQRAQRSGDEAQYLAQIISSPDLAKL
jgi:hypothetical protein